MNQHVPFKAQEHQKMTDNPFGPIGGNSASVDAPEFIADRDEMLLAPDVSGYSVDQMAALHDGIVDLQSHLNGMMSKPRFSDSETPKPAADFLQKLCEFLGDCSEQIYEELWNAIPSSKHERDTRAKKLIEIAIRDDEQIETIAARAALLAEQIKGQSH